MVPALPLSNHQVSNLQLKKVSKVQEGKAFLSLGVPLEVPKKESSVCASTRPGTEHTGSSTLSLKGSGMDASSHFTDWEEAQRGSVMAPGCTADHPRC